MARRLLKPKASLEVFDTATLRTSTRVEKFHHGFVTVDRMGVPAVNTVLGQVARLAVVNDGTTTERETLSIVNAMGDVLTSRSVSVAPGRVAMVQVAIGSSRMEVHGTVEPHIFPVDLQVFDMRSQRTIALVEDFKVGPPMSGNVTSPSIGLISGQTARLSVVNNGTATESETLSIMNGLGVTLASRTFSILPGQSVAIQVPGGRSRAEIHANIGPLIFPADLQVLDNTSGQTLTLTELFFTAPP